MLMLKGTVEGIRPVAGQYHEGKKQGEWWYFLSMEVKDATFGQVYSCQLRDDDPLFKEYVEVVKPAGSKPAAAKPAASDSNAGPADSPELKLKQDIKGHVVKMAVRNVIAGERNMRQRVFKSDAEKKKNIGYEEQAVPVVRFQITGLVSEGAAKYDFSKL